LQLPTTLARLWPPYARCRPSYGRSSPRPSARASPQRDIPTDFVSARSFKSRYLSAASPESSWSYGVVSWPKVLKANSTSTKFPGNRISQLSERATTSIFSAPVSRAHCIASTNSYLHKNGMVFAGIVASWQPSMLLGIPRLRVQADAETYRGGMGGEIYDKSCC